MKYACLVRLEWRVCIRGTRRGVVRTVQPGTDQSFLDMPGFRISYLYGTTKKREMTKTS